MTEHGCTEAELRAEMDDAEFWEHVFRPIADDVAEHFEVYYVFDPYGVDRGFFGGYPCVRCGDFIADADTFCEDCLDNMQPDVEETW